jgi:hypothetical protein
MKAGDRVEIHYTNGRAETGEIVGLEQEVVIVRVTSRAGTIMVSPERLIAAAPGHWRLDF